MGEINICMECGVIVVDGENGWVDYLPEENHIECMCNECQFELDLENMNSEEFDNAFEPAREYLQTDWDKQWSDLGSDIETEECPF